VNLREQQVLRRLGATPLPRLTLLASQVAMRLTLAVFQTALMLGVGVLVYRVQVTGSWPGLAAFVLLGAGMLVSLGYVIAAVSRTAESVTGLTSVLNFPMMFLSGIFFPMDLGPKWLLPAIRAIPLTYLGDALRQVMVGAPGNFSLLTDALVLAAWLAVCTVISVRFFRWE
jgi:ABC-2 type transport system permease protein